jgi:hypothetical protein
MAQKPLWGGCQEGLDEVGIFSHFLDTLMVGNLDVYIGSLYPVFIKS